jgi:hypothetical protein
MKVLTSVAFLSLLAIAACTGNAGSEDPATLETTTSEALTDQQVANGYACLASGAAFVGGAAGVLTCGIAEFPSGGLATLCLVGASTSLVGGSASWCANQCQGFRGICPGYGTSMNLKSFRELGKVVGRCVGTARYSHWEYADAALVRKYGKRGTEYRDGNCTCPRGRACAEP